MDNESVVNPPKNAMTKAAETIHSWGMVHWLIFLTCFVSFLGYTKIIVGVLPDLGYIFATGMMSPLEFAVVFLRPTLLLIAGTLLLFRRKVATYLFGAYILLAVFTMPEGDKLGWMAFLLIVVAFLSFSVREHRAGELK